MLPDGPTLALFPGARRPDLVGAARARPRVVLVLSGYILLERRPPMSTLAWILGLVFLPGLGIFAWYVLGRAGSSARS